MPGEAKITLFNHGIFQFGNALSVVLVNLYLWRLTNDLWINGAFNFITLISAPLATMYIGRIAKLKDRLFAYRSGIFLTALFYLFIVLAGERMVDYYIFFAVLKGVSTSFYWLGHFTMITDVTDNANRHKYLGWNLIITNVAMLAGPAAAGLILDLAGGMNGYTYVYLLAFAMFAYATVNSLKMKRRPTHHRTYYLKYSIAMMRKHPAFGRSLWGWFVFGLPQGVLSYIPAILLFEAVPRESFVNYMNVLFFSVTIASSYALARRGRTERNADYLRYAALGFLVGSIPLFFGIELWTVVAFMLLFSLVKPLQNNAYTSFYYKLSGELPLGAHFRIEAVVLREVFTNAGRAAGVIALMITTSYVSADALTWVLTIVAALQLAIGWLASPRFPKYHFIPERKSISHESR
ncbi:MFS transporter [Paenibacillus sp. TRM 82003]|nr:MFS transporter [Paenibacillus sp. TRM 82003]